MKSDKTLPVQYNPTQPKSARVLKKLFVLTVVGGRLKSAIFPDSGAPDSSKYLIELR